MRLYRDLLAPEGELLDFRIDGLDRLGIPIVTASLWPWGSAGSPAARGRSPHGSGGVHGTGYGTTEHEAARGALGELVEGQAAHTRIAALPRERATLRELGPEAVDPRDCCLPAGSPFTPDTELLWVRARRWPDGAGRWVPIELAATCFADLGDIEPPSGAWLTTPITNGLGAGDTAERALAHGLLELVQRDGNSATYRALDRGVVVDVDECGDELRELLGRFEAAGIDVLVKLAATDLGMADVYVVGRERDPGAAGHPLMVTSCGEAAHPDRERAVRKALLEYASSRARKAFCQTPLDALDGIAPARYAELVAAEEPVVEEDRALDAMLDWLRRPAAELQALMAPAFHAERERVPLSSLPHADVPEDPAALLDLVGGRLRDAGLEVLWVALGPHAGRAIVPGLEVETATYHRCGPRNRERLQQLGLAGTGAPPPGASPLAAPGGGWLAADAIDRLVGDLYPLYREPDRHVAGKLLARR